MLLRRLARRAGDGIVFEPSDRELQRLVHLRFERLLSGMFRLGAFAGAVPAEAFEISTGDNVNPPASVELGRFVVEVRFAPSRPLEFITVRLVLAGVAGAEARS
jgi:phage tail sheath protein FI